MFFKSSTLATLSALLLVGTSANPIRRASGCNPNAQGKPVSIQSATYPGLEWGLQAPAVNGANVYSSSYRGLSTPDWYIRQSGQSPTTYYITDVDTGLAATVYAGFESRVVELNPQNFTGYQANQLFDITCDFCGTDVSPGSVLASGCSIVLGDYYNVGPTASDPVLGTGQPTSDNYTLLL